MSTYTPDHPVSQPEAHTPDPILIQTLAGLNASDGLRSAQTARRRVAGKIICVRQQKEKTRRNRATAIMASLGILVLLSPAIWQSVENCIVDGHFGDMGSQVTLLILLLFTALMAALIAGWRNGQEVRHAKRDS